MSYDRTVYLEFFNGPDIYNRDLKSGKTRIADPRLNLTMAGHIEDIIKQINDEVLNYCDGLMQRFLINAPLPHQSGTSEEMRNHPKPVVSLLCLLYSIEFYFHDMIDLEFSQCGLQKLDEFIDSYREVIRVANNIDQFIALVTKTNFFKTKSIFLIKLKLLNLHL